MVNQIISRVGTRQFQISWQGVRNSSLFLDFNPLVSQFELKRNFILLHWQARPKPWRTWGAYDEASGLYYSFNDEEFDFNAIAPSRLIEIDEQKWATVPSSVVLFENCYLRRSNKAVTVHESRWFVKKINAQW